MVALSSNVARTTLDIEKAQVETSLAQSKHQQALQMQREREEWLNSYSARTPASQAVSLPNHY
jgi:hypothetical protein